MSGASLHLSIVSSNPDETTVAQFKKKADQLGINSRIVDITLDDIATGKADEKLGNAVLWRLSSLGPSGNGAGWELLKGRISVNTGLYIMPEIGNKYFQQQIIQYSDLQEFAIPTFYVGSYQKLALLIDQELLSYPVVLKPVHGSSAQGVTYIEDDQQARAHTQWDGFVAESYIENDGEWRVFVVGGVATGAMKKVAAPGRKFNLVSPGAQISSEKDDVTRDRLYDIATKVASLFHTELNGVDIVRDKQTGEYKIFEVNVSPGWQNKFDITTGEDIPARVLEWFSERFSAASSLTGQLISSYMVRRSHRLPLVDELRLLDMLFDTDPAVSARMSVHKDRLLGGAQFQRVVQAIASRLESVELNNLTEALHILDVLKRRYKYNPEDVITESWDKVREQAHARCEQAKQEKYKYRSSVDFVMLCARLGIYPKPSFSLEQIESDGLRNHEIDEEVAYLNGILLNNLTGEAAVIIEKIDHLISENFYDINIEHKMEFVKNAHSYNYDSKLCDFIMSYAATLCSWAGNFLIEDISASNRMNTSTKHTLLQGYYASALYCQLVR